MTTPELIQYVKNEIANGIPKDIIIGKLKTQGWTDFDVAEVFNAIPQMQSVYTPSVIPNIPVENKENTNLEQPVGVATPMILHSESRFSSSISPIQNTESVNVTENSNQAFSPEPIKETLYKQPVEQIQHLEPIAAINTMNSAMESIQIKPSPSKNYLKIALFIIIPIVVLFGGFVLYASGYFIKTGTLFSNWINSSKENTSLAFEVNLNIDASQMKFDTGGDTSEMDKYKVINFSMKGDSDYSDIKNVKFNNSLLFKAAEIEAGIDTKMINQSIYLNLTKAPDLGFFSLKPFENKWIVIPVKDESGEIANNPLLAMSPIDAGLFAGMTDEQNKKISEIINNASFIKITKKHLPAMMDGSLSYHFEYDLDKEGIISFMKEMATYMNSLSEGEIDTSDITDDDYNKIFTYIKNFKGEAWIGIFDKLPHKMTIDMEVVNPEKLEDGAAKIALSVIYSNWNEPILVEIPPKTVTIEELTSEVMGGMFGGGDPRGSEITQSEEQAPIEVDLSDPFALEAARTKAKTASIKSILASMRAQAEIFYDSSGVNSYKGFCSSKGEYGAYQLAKTLPENSVYKCRDGIKEWSAYVKLPDNSYWCSDSSGYSSNVTKIPTGTVCSLN